MFPVVLALACLVLLLLAFVMNNSFRIKALEDKIDQTKCILLHPERESAWCPAGEDRR